MKHSDYRKKRGFFAYVGIFLLFYFLFSIVGSFTYGLKHPGTETLPSDYSSVLMKASTIPALAGTIFIAFLPSIKGFLYSKTIDLIPEKVRYRTMMALDFLFFLFKSALLFIAVFCILSMFGLTKTEDQTTIVIISSFICSLIVCGKSYRRTYLKRQLDHTHKEIDRLEREIEAIEAAKKEAMFQSVAFIDCMDGHEFEYWCAEFLSRIGFEDVEVTKASGDDGVDILAKKEGIRYAIQCKCYSSNLGNTPIQEVHAGKDVYHCQMGAVMTNRYFTEGGKRVAEATGTLLWDRDWIINNFAKLNSK